MIKSYFDLKEYIETDRIRNRVPKSFLKYHIQLICGYENAYIFRYLRNLRKTEYHKNKYENGGGMYLIHKLLYVIRMIRHKRLSLKYGISLQPNVAGKGLRIMQISAGGVLLNAKIIGDYCGFNTGVVLGNKDYENNRPSIGNHVAYAPGSKAFGNINIGDNSFIAPNAIVTKDMPNDSIIAGIPAKVIKSKPIRC